jgi:hypothetical protein
MIVALFHGVRRVDEMSHRKLGFAYNDPQMCRSAPHDSPHFHTAPKVSANI